MLFIHAKLLKIDSKPDMKNPQIMTHRLVFKSERYDAGLDSMVACSLAVKVHEDHVYHLPVYQKFIGSVCAVPVSISTMDRNVFYKTAYDGVAHDFIDRPNQQKTA